MLFKCFLELCNESRQRKGEFLGNLRLISLPFTTKMFSFIEIQNINLVLLINPLKTVQVLRIISTMRFGILAISLKDLICVFKKKPTQKTKHQKTKQQQQKTINQETIRGSKQPSLYCPQIMQKPPDPSPEKDNKKQIVELLTD